MKAWFLRSLIALAVLMSVGDAHAQTKVSVTYKGKYYDLMWSYAHSYVVSDEELSDLMGAFNGLSNGGYYIPDLTVSDAYQPIRNSQGGSILFKGKRLTLSASYKKWEPDIGEVVVDDSKAASEMYDNYYEIVRSQYPMRPEGFSERQRLLVYADGRLLSGPQYDEFVIDLDHLAKTGKDMPEFDLASDRFFHLGRKIDLTVQYAKGNQWFNYDDKGQETTYRGYYNAVASALKQRRTGSEPDVTRLKGIQDFVKYKGESTTIRVFYDGKELDRATDEGKAVFESVQDYFRAAKDPLPLAANADYELFYNGKKVDVYFQHKITRTLDHPGQQKEISIYYCGYDLAYLDRKLKVHTRELLHERRDALLVAMKKGLDPEAPFDTTHPKAIPVVISLSKDNPCAKQFEFLAHDIDAVTIKRKLAGNKTEVLGWVHKPRALDCSGGSLAVVAYDVAIGKVTPISRHFTSNLSPKGSELLKKNQYTGDKSVLAIFEGAELASMRKLPDTMAGDITLRRGQDLLIVEPRDGSRGLLLAKHFNYDEALGYQAPTCDKHYRLYAKGGEILVLDRANADRPVASFSGVIGASMVACVGDKLGVVAQGFAPKIAGSNPVKADRPTFFAFAGGKLVHHTALGEEGALTSVQAIAESQGAEVFRVGLEGKDYSVEIDAKTLALSKPYTKGELCRNYRLLRGQDDTVELQWLGGDTARRVGRFATIASFACEQNSLALVATGLAAEGGLTGPLAPQSASLEQVTTAKSPVFAVVEQGNFRYFSVESEALRLGAVVAEPATSTFRLSMTNAPMAASVALDGSNYRLTNFLADGCSYKLSTGDNKQWTLDFLGNEAQGARTVGTLEKPVGIGCEGGRVFGLVERLTAADQSSPSKPQSGFMYAKDGALVLVRADHDFDANGPRRVVNVAGFTERSFFARDDSGAELVEVSDDGRTYQVVAAASLTPACAEYRVVKAESGFYELVRSSAEEPKLMAQFKKFGELACQGSTVGLLAEGLVAATAETAPFAKDDRQFLLTFASGQPSFHRQPVEGEAFSGLTFSPNGGELIAKSSQQGVEIVYEMSTSSGYRKLGLPTTCNAVEFHSADDRHFSLRHQQNDQSDLVLTFLPSRSPTCEGDRVYLSGAITEVNADAVQLDRGHSNLDLKKATAATDAFLVVEAGKIVVARKPIYGEHFDSFKPVRRNETQVLVELYEAGMTHPTSLIDVATRREVISGNHTCDGYSIAKTDAGYAVRHAQAKAQSIVAEDLVAVSCYQDRLAVVTAGQINDLFEGEELQRIVGEKPYALSDAYSAPTAAFVFTKGELTNYFLAPDNDRFARLQVMPWLEPGKPLPSFRLWVDGNAYSYVFDVGDLTLKATSYVDPLADLSRFNEQTEHLASVRSHGSSAEEQKSISEPKVLIGLKSRSQIRPGLAVLVGDTLYYTNYIGRDDTCLGHHVYRSGLVNRREERVVDLRCVTALRTDGQRLFVTSRGPNEQQVTQELVGDRLKPAFESVTTAFTARLSEAARRSGSADDSVGKPLAVSVNEDNYALLAEGGASGQSRLDLFDALSGAPRWSSLATIQSPGAITDFIASGDRRHVYFVTKQGGREQVGVARTDQASGLALYGDNAALKAWRSADAGHWSVQSPRFLTGLHYGFVVFDNNQNYNQEHAVSYYSPEQKRFYRVMIDDEDIGGISKARGGILVSRPLQREIVWYGSSVPFKDDEVTKGDVKHNPFVPEID